LPEPDQEDPKSQAKQEATDRLAAARRDRDKEIQDAIERANDTFWRVVNSVVASRVLNQREAADAIGYGRETVRTNTARVREETTPDQEERT
jgi:hypothetical protein